MQAVNLQPYQPTDQEKIDLQNAHNIHFLQDEDGSDWYDSRELFDPQKIKIIVDNEGVIIGADTDVYAMHPEGFSVYEVSSVPEGFNTDREWKWENGAIVSR